MSKEKRKGASWVLGWQVERTFVFILTWVRCSHFVVDHWWLSIPIGCQREKRKGGRRTLQRPNKLRCLRERKGEPWLCWSLWLAWGSFPSSLHRQCNWVILTEFRKDGRRHSDTSRDLDFGGCFTVWAWQRCLPLFRGAEDGDLFFWQSYFQSLILWLDAICRHHHLLLPLPSWPQSCWTSFEGDVERCHRSIWRGT